MSREEHQVVGEDAELALPLAGGIRPGTEGAAEPPLVPAERGLDGPPQTVHAPGSAPLGLLAEPLDHLPPELGFGPLPALAAGVDRDDGGTHPEILPRVPVVRLGIECGVGQNPVPGDDQGRLGHDRSELGGVIRRAGGDGRPGEEVGLGVAGDGQLGPQPGRVLAAGPLEEVPGRVPALQPGPVDGRGRFLTDQAAIGCGRGGTEKEEDDLPLFSSREAA